MLGLARVPLLPLRNKEQRDCLACSCGKVYTRPTAESRSALSVENRD